MNSKIDSNQDVYIEMLNDSNLIKNSVEFLKSQIEKKLVEFETLLHNSKDVPVDEYDSSITLVEAQILFLLSKIRNEELEMDKFLLKYKGLKNEKQNMSFGCGEKGQIHLRGFSPYEEGETGCNNLQKEIM